MDWNCFGMRRGRKARERSGDNENREREIMKGNSVSIKGNITRDAEVRSTSGGSLVIEFGIAWNSSRKNAQTGEYEDVPHYFDCFAWVTESQLRSIQGQIVKGASCAIVDGSLDYTSWDDGQGNKRSKVRIKVNDPIAGLLVKPRQGQPQAAQQQMQMAQPPYEQKRQPAAQYQQPSPRYQQPAAQQQAYAGQYAQQPVYSAAGATTASIYDEEIPF